MGATDLHCQLCDKRISRKSARQINGRIVCSGCMWKPRLARDAIATEAGTAETAKTGSVHGGAGR